MNIGSSPSLPSSAAPSPLILNRSRRASSDESAESSSEAEGPPSSRCPTLADLSLRALDLEKLTYGGECLAKSLNYISAKITGPDKIRKLAPEWLSALPKSVVQHLTARFLHCLSEIQLRALTPEQISWINLDLQINSEILEVDSEILKEWTITFLLSLTPWQVQSLTREQIRNIPISIIQTLTYEHFNLKPYPWLTYLTLEQLSGLTNEQINSIFKILRIKMYNFRLIHELDNMGFFQMPRIFRMLNRGSSRIIMDEGQEKD